jgi:hypothetical protein
MKMNEKKEFKIDEDAIFERACERVGIRVSKAVEIVEVVEVWEEVIGASAGLGEEGVGEKLAVNEDEGEGEMAGSEVR